MAYNFSQVIAVLMRDPNFKNLRIADLEWLVFPALLSGQFKLAHAQAHPGKNKDDHGGSFIPVALAMWARVSPQVDKALSENIDKPAQLRPDQWSSGDSGSWSSPVTSAPFRLSSNSSAKRNSREIM